MKVLLIGSRGMLGRAFIQALEQRGDEWTSADRPEFDLSDPTSIPPIDDGLDLVVCCAAWTDVDGAESQEEAALAVNGAGVGRLATHCQRASVPLVHFSTDYVFSGRADAPYAADAPLQPVNAYGRGKAEGEKAIIQSGAEHLTIRTSWLYAPWGQNFALTMKRLTSDRDSLRVVNDQRGRPTSCQHLASTTLALFLTGARGTHHITDGGECTWYEFACHVRDVVGAECTIDPCSSDEYPRPAPRPSYSVLELSQTEALVGPMPRWQDQVRAALDELHG